jgi:hypothetical protein
VLFALSCEHKSDITIEEFDRLYRFVKQNRITFSLENVSIIHRGSEDQYLYSFVSNGDINYWFSIKNIWGYDLKLYRDGEKKNDEILKRNFPEKYDSIKADILLKINIVAEIFYNFSLQAIHSNRSQDGFRTIYFSSRDNKTLIISEDSSTINKFTQDNSVLIKKYNELDVLINQ